MLTEIIGLCIASYFVNGCSSEPETNTQKEKIKKECEQKLEALRDTFGIVETCMKNEKKSRQECINIIEGENNRKKWLKERGKICDCMIKSSDFNPNSPLTATDKSLKLLQNCMLRV